MAKEGIIKRIKSAAARGLRFSRLGGVGLPVFKSFRSTTNVDGMFIPFTGSGLAVPTQNSFPETLAKIAADSPTHGSAIKVKSLLTFGQGFDMEAMNPKVKAWFEKINEEGDTGNDVLERIGIDYENFDGCAFKVRWTGSKTIADVEHVPFKTVRIGKPENRKVTYFIISNNWANNLPQELENVERVPAFNPDKITEAKVFTDSESGKTDREIDQTSKENAVQLVYFAKYSAAGDGYYPVPDYIHGMDSAITEVDTGIAMRNGLENGIQGATVVTSNTDTPLDDTTKQQVADTLDEIATGAANAWSLLFMPANVKLTQLKPIDADTYKEINAESRQRLITAHRIPAILLEAYTSGGFNNRAEELKAAIEMFQETYILNRQQRLTRMFNSLLAFVDGGEGETVRIVPFLEGKFEEKTEEKESDESGENKADKKETKDKTNLEKTKA